MALPPDTVEVRLLLTNAQARAFLTFLDKGAFAATFAAGAADERAEMEGAIWATRRQFRAAGIRAGDEGA